MKELKIDISIIIPIYNGEAFIENAYNMILNQDLSSFEIIFINNNSTDQSVSLIKRLIKQDQRLSIFHEKKQGAGAARNLGIEKAIGNYIYLFDVDDILFDNALKTLKKILDDYPNCDSVFGKSIKTDTLDVNFDIAKYDTNTITNNAPPYWGLAWFKNDVSIATTPSFLHRKHVFNKVGNFPDTLLLGEDTFFHIKLGLHSNILQIDHYIIAYYRHSESTVSKQNAKQIHKVFTYWPQYIYAYLPYSFKYNVPLEFKHELLKQIYGGFFKMVALTTGIISRLRLTKQLEREINPLKLPILFHFYVYLIVFTGSIKIYKFFYFYILPNYLNSMEK